jgi:type 1 glutamine amidotransferase
MDRRLFLFAFLLMLAWPLLHAAEPAHIVMMIGEDEYHTWETLPEFAEKELKPLGYRVSIINADATDKNRFPGLIAALKDADLLVLSVRRRTPPQDELEAVRAYLQSGKPLVGIRTACHAFALRPNEKLASPELASWQEFDPEVLGGHYTNHHANGILPAISVAPGAEASPLLQGVSIAKLSGHGSLYKVNPLEPDAVPLLFGAIPDQPTETVAWTRLYGPGKARVFYTSLGHPGDFESSDFRRLLLNGIHWALER